MEKLFIILIITCLTTDLSKAQVTYQSQFDENLQILQMNIMKERSAAFENNRKYIDNLIDWIYELKRQTDDEEFIYAMNVYYKKLRSFDGKDYEALSGAIRQVELGIKEEIDKYNSRLKKNQAKYDAEIAEANNAQVLWKKGNDYYNNREYIYAIREYNKVKQLEPEFNAVYLYCGNSYEHLGKLDQALSDYSMFLQLAPNESIGYIYRGWLYHKNEDFIKAIADFNSYIKLKPNIIEGYIARGTSKHKLNDYYGAIADFKKSIEIKPNSSAYNGIAWAKFAMKKYSEALVMANKAIEYDDKNTNALDTRFEIKFALKDYNGCVNDCNKALKINSELPNAYFLLGRSSYRLGNKQKACEYWSKAGELGESKAYEYISKYCNN